MFNRGKVAVELIQRDLDLVNPAISTSDPENAPFEYHQLCAFDADAFAFEHGAFLILMEALIEGVALTLEHLYSAMFLNGEEKTNL